MPAHRANDTSAARHALAVDAAVAVFESQSKSAFSFPLHPGAFRTVRSLLKPAAGDTDSSLGCGG
eukprot:15467952-Alexandrium_andersonii.AAC.1